MSINRAKRNFLYGDEMNGSGNGLLSQGSILVDLAFKDAQRLHDKLGYFIDKRIGDLGFM